MTEPQTAEEWANELFFPEATVPVSLGNGTTLFTHGLGWGSSLAKNVAVIKQIQAQARLEALDDTRQQCERGLLILCNQTVDILEIEPFRKGINFCLEAIRSLMPPEET